MVKALGQLPNAPLVYVLAQVRFSHVPHMERRWEDFHESIFSTYPKAQPERIEQLIFKDGQPSTMDSTQRWHLVNGTNDTGVLFDAGMLVFHTTAYKTSEIFLSDLEQILAAFARILPEQGMPFSRLGLRYVDLLLPEKGLTVDEQVIDALRLPRLSSDIGKAGRMEQIITYHTPIAGTLNIRHRQSITSDVLPSDIFPNKLEDAPRLKRKPPTDESDTVGLLDYDHFIEKESPFDKSSIISEFRELRDISSAAFKATTTEAAREIWGKETKQ